MAENEQVDMEEKYYEECNSKIDFVFVVNKEYIKSADSFNPLFCNQYVPSSLDLQLYKNNKLKIIFDLKTMDSCFYSDENLTLPIFEEIVDFVNENRRIDCQHFANLVEPIGEELYVCMIDFRDSKHQEFHKKLHLITLSYIDAASFVEYDDKNWRAFYVFKKSMKELYLVGFCTVYHFWMFNDNIRPRIGQFIIFPPFQNQNIATTLLRHILIFYEKIENVCDVTVEDPNEEFCCIHDSIDLLRCRKLKIFEQIKLPKELHSRISADMRNILKITPQRQVMLCEMLALCACESEHDYQEWRKQVFQRMSQPIQDQLVRTLRIRTKYSQDIKVQMCGDIKQSIESLNDILATAEDTYLTTLKRVRKLTDLEE